MWTRKRREQELDEELRAHLAMETRRRVERGEAPEAARQAALRDLGSLALVAETTREAWGWSALFAFGQDVRYAVRLLAKNPALTLTAVLSLGLGIGATTSIFGVINAVALRPMAVAEPDRLVVVQPLRIDKRWILFNPMFDGLRAKQDVLEGMFAVSDQAYLKTQFEGSSAPSYLTGSFVSGNYFTTLGITPAAGRFFREEEDVLPGAPGSPGCPAVIGFRLWSQRFGRNASVLGQHTRVGSTECTIIGVAPEALDSHLQGYIVDIWVPMHQAMPARLFSDHNLAFFSGVMGRLRPGVTRVRAEAALTGLFQQLQAAEPPAPPRSPSRKPTPAEVSIKLLPGAHGLETLGREYNQFLGVLLALAAIVLAIASFNAANLLMARGATRASEFATRTALGAGRGRLIRQLATEAAVLSLCGGALGMTLALAATPILGSRISLPWLMMKIDTAPDLRVAGVALAATAFAALLGGLLPAVRLSRTSLQANLAGAGRTTGGRPARRLAASLVVAQLALSLLLLASTGLLVRTMTRIASIDPGFRPEHVVAIDLRDESPAAITKVELAARYRAVEQRLHEIPGVESASLSWLGLFGGNDLGLALLDPEHPAEHTNVHVDYVSARYFETAGMRIRRGRGFSDGDLKGASRVAVINEALVRVRFADREPIGRRVSIDYQGEEEPFTIVGVVADSKYNDLREKSTDPMMWMPMQQAIFKPTFAMLRVRAGNETAVGLRAREVLAATAPLLMIRKITTLAAQVDRATGRQRLLLGLAAAFGWAALVLAAIGLYGSLACTVAQRTREIGVRMALGAQPSAVSRSIVGSALVYVAWAVGIGMPLAWMAGRALKGFLFGVEPLDGVALGGACLVLGVAAVVAAYLPARRAAAIDPIAALRYE